MAKEKSLEAKWTNNKAQLILSKAMVETKFLREALKKAEEGLALVEEAMRATGEGFSG